MRNPLGRSYVQVRLGSRLYTYYCPGVAVGELVQVPPSEYVAAVQTVPVVKLGRGHWGKVREAWPCPSIETHGGRVARGLEDERGHVLGLTNEELRREPGGDLFHDPQAGALSAAGFTPTNEHEDWHGDAREWAT